MGKDSVQIRKHIENERANLDRNLSEIERRFAETKDTITRWWNSPALLIGAAFAAGVVLAELTSERESTEER